MPQQIQSLMRRHFMIIALFLVFTAAKAQNPVGIFDNHSDIGKVLHKGTATFDNSTQTYQLAGAGENIWFKKDELHFLWKKLKGDFLVTTQPSLLGKGVNPHRKSGWMILSL